MKAIRFTAAALAVSLCIALLCPAALADEGDVTVKLNQKSVSLAVGDTVQLSADVSDGQDVTWASLTTDVAQVDETGLVTATGEGKATIKATTADGTVSANCTVSVYLPLPSYSLREGEQVRLSSSLSGTWSSRNPDIASVSSSGTVTGNSFGRTYVTVSDGDESETFAVTVGAHVGIDISSWNNTIDWDALKRQGIEYVFIRAGYGWEHTDARFVENIEGAIAHDMPVGIYFYSYAETAEKAQVEANYCAKLLAPYRDEITLPVAYDLEEYKSLSGAQLEEFSEIFCSTLQQAGFHTMVYANNTFFSKMTLSGLRDLGVDFWYAWYPTVPSLSTLYSVGRDRVHTSIWQYTSSGVVPGALASGKTDLNLYYMPESLNFSAPSLNVLYNGTAAQLTWGGSTYASSYTVFRKLTNGDVQTVGTYDGTVHSCTDTAYLPGMGYFVTMQIADPISGAAYRSYTTDAVYPETAQFVVTVTAGEGGTATGGGSFVVGKTATVRAAAQDGYTFDGWYDAAGKKRSAQEEYSFTVTDSLSLTAKFTKKEVPAPAPAGTFTDVSDSDWYAQAVAYVVENGLFTGTSDTTFTPGGTMTRGMLVTVLYRQAGSPEVSNHNKFRDVSATAWYAKAVTWAYNNGVVNGTGDKTFSPEAPVSREQIATILMRYSTYAKLDLPETTTGDLSAFSDGASVSSYAQEGMRWAVSTQLMNGSNNALRPLANASRAECATLLMRMLDSTQEQ